MDYQKISEVTPVSHTRLLLGFATLLSLLVISGCDGDVTGDKMNALKANPDSDSAGPYIVYGGMVIAADFLDVPFEAVKKTIESPPEVAHVTNGMSVDLSEGQVVLMPGPGPDQQVFGKLEYQNTSSEKLVLFLESLGPDGVSQGISIIKLEPGDKFVFAHNVPPWAVRLGTLAGDALAHTATKATVVVTLVVVVAEEVGEFIESFGTCTRTGKFLQPDVCVGSCTGGRGCYFTTTQTYGPAFMGMVEPTACACQ